MKEKNIILLDEILDLRSRKRKELEYYNQQLEELKMRMFFIQKEIDFYNQRFGKWEQIKKFEITPDEWSIEEGLLTPTMKMKRKVIKEKYKNLYQV